MRIHLLDPGYIHRGGHHVEWDLLIADDLVRRGHEVQLFCYANAVEDARQAFAKYGPATPLFPSPYVAPRNPVNDLSLFVDVAAQLASKLSQLPPAELWVWPTLFAPQLLACAKARPGMPISGVLHLEPTYNAPGGQTWWGYAFEKAKQAGLKLNLGANTTELQGIYSGLSSGYPIKCVPIAQDGLRASAQKTSMKRIGMFGHQRQEKGTTLMRPLISSLLEEGYAVVLQDSQGRIGIGEHPNLTTLGYVENFAQTLSECDLVVLPYNPDDYRIKLSGVAAEAVASGVPIVAPVGTTVEQLVHETGAGTLFAECSAESILAAVHEARARYPELAKKAFKTSQEWPARNGIHHFASSLLEGAAA